MGIFREIPPTAGLPLYLKDLFSPFLRERRSGSLEEAFRNYLNVPYAKVTYSGTAAFYLILESLKKISSKKTVIIPSFICPLVPLAIKRAGLKVVVCDINKDDFNFEPEQLQNTCSENPDILAIVAVHLAGIPLDFQLLEQIAASKKILIIEDCAQSLGAIYKDKKVGSLGDFSFFSLCRGKGLTIYEGGLIVTKRAEFSALIDSTIENLTKNDHLSESLKVFELFGYWIFYRPFLFWLVFRLPQIFWNIQGKPLKALTEYFTVDFPIHRVSKIRKIIGTSCFPRLESSIKAQRKKAMDYANGLRDVKGIKLITEQTGTLATYPYLTLLFDDVSRRSKALKLLQNSGLGVFQIYASSITDYDYLKGILGNTNAPNARRLAACHLSLTTSSFLKQDELDSIVEVIKGL